MDTAGTRMQDLFFAQYTAVTVYGYSGQPYGEFEKGRLQQKMLQQLPREMTLGLWSSGDTCLLWAVLLVILFALSLHLIFPYQLTADIGCPHVVLNRHLSADSPYLLLSCLNSLLGYVDFHIYLPCNLAK